jgi:PAS domain S-box-containing protein
LGTNHVARIERQLATAQQITHIGSWEWDLTTGAVAWSDELYRIYGYAPGEQEITLDFFVSRLHPDDRHAVECAIAAAVERGGSFRWLERIVHTSGALRELDTRGEAVCDHDGRVTGLIGTCRDVTDEQERARQLRLYEDIVRSVQIGLSVWDVQGGQESPVLACFNPASERIMGRPLAAWVGRSLQDIAPYAAAGEVETILARVARERLVHEVQIERSKDPTRPTRALAVKAFPLPGNSVGLAIEDVTEQTLERRLRAAEHRVLSLIAEGAPLCDALDTLVLAVEDHSPPTIGSILLLDHDGVHMRHGSAPHLPTAYCTAVDGLAIGDHTGSCGTAMFLKKPVFVEDIATDPLWQEYKDLALIHGLHACWSVPILATDHRVLGSFAFYYASPRAPTENEVAVTTRVAHLAGIAIERKQLETQLRELSAHVETAVENERTGIAREIHDELGQSLTALKMDIAWILRRATSASVPLTTDQLLEKLITMSSLTDDVVGQVRRISSELRPGVLDDLGLVAAIEWQADEFEARTGTPCSVRVSHANGALDRQLSTAVFRIFQEALTNVTRHACAAHVDVLVDVTAEQVVLEVKDDGVGITPEAAQSPKSLGLLGIRERAHRLGGAVAIGRGAPGGTVVLLCVPTSGASHDGAASKTNGACP